MQNYSNRCLQAMRPAPRLAKCSFFPIVTADKLTHFSATVQIAGRMFTELIQWAMMGFKIFTSLSNLSGFVIKSTAPISFARVIVAGLEDVENMITGMF